MKTFLVTIKSDQPPENCAAYISEAINCWCGSYPPEDAFFGLSEDDVEVTYCGEKPNQS